DDAVSGAALEETRQRVTRFLDEKLSAARVASSSVPYVDSATPVTMGPPDKPVREVRLDYCVVVPPSSQPGGDGEPVAVRIRDAYGRGYTAFGPVSPHGQNPTPCAPALQHAYATVASTVRWDTPGLIARTPAITACTVAAAAARTLTISDGLWTSRSAWTRAPTSFN